jgi:hypothetical protein
MMPVAVARSWRIIVEINVDYEEYTVDIEKNDATVFRSKFDPVSGQFFTMATAFEAAVRIKNQIEDAEEGLKGIEA